MGGGTRRGSGPPSEPRAAQFVQRLPWGWKVRPRLPRARLAGRRAAQTVGFLGARVGAPGEGGAPEPPCSEGRLAALAPLASTLGLE